MNDIQLIRNIIYSEWEGFDGLIGEGKEADEALTRLEESARAVLNYASMGYHMAATDEEWHESLRKLNSVLNGN